MCLVNMSDLAKVLLQRSHMCGSRLPPSVDRDLCLEAMCLASLSAMPKTWPQMEQTKTTSADESGGVPAGSEMLEAS